MLRPTARLLRSAGATPGLPPLPGWPSWKTYFPSKQLANPPDMLCREFPGRVLLSNPELCDEFVKALGVREGEVVLEYNPGPGQLTRSLLEGGSGTKRDNWSEEELIEVQAISKAVHAEEAEAAKARGKSGMRTTSKTGKQEVVKRIGKDLYPAWAKEQLAAIRARRKTDESGTSGPSDQATSQLDEPLRPKLVVAIEPSAEIVRSGFDTPAEKGGFTPNPIDQGSSAGGNLTLMMKGLSSSQLRDHAAAVGDAVPLAAPKAVRLPVTASPYDDRLIVSHSTAYTWSTLPALLSHPLIAGHLPDAETFVSQSADQSARHWSDEAPPITLVAHIPDAVNGEQLLAQWVGSAAGDAQSRNWIWKWGRIRMALLLGKGSYDRLTALPGETINSKLSIMTRALYDIKPLPPYHHVPNIDRASKLTEGRPVRNSTSVYYVQRWGRTDPAKLGVLNHKEIQAQTAAPVEHPWDHYPRTTTYHRDFYPMASRRSLTPTQYEIEPVPRPRLLGLLLEPKKESFVLGHQKDSWDYVLRSCFVNYASPLREAMKNLSFNGDGLADKLIDPSNYYKGKAVDPMKTVRDLDVEEWARVVDCFDRWPFRPENLLLAGGPVMDELTREIGQD